MDELDKIGINIIDKMTENGDIPRNFLIRQRGKSKVEVELTEDMLMGDDLKEVVEILDKKLLEIN